MEDAPASVPLLDRPASAAVNGTLLHIDVHRVPDACAEFAGREPATEKNPLLHGHEMGEQGTSSGQHRDTVDPLLNGQPSTGTQRLYPSTCVH